MNISRRTYLIIAYLVVTLMLFCGALFGNEIQNHIPTVIAGLWMSLGISWWLAPLPEWSHDIVEAVQWLVTLVWCALLCWPILLAALKPKLFKRIWLLGILVIHIVLLVFLMVQGYEIYKAAIHPGGV